jgi:hypothetical protein
MSRRRRISRRRSKEMVIWLSGRKAPPDLIVGGEEAAPCQREKSCPVVDLPAAVAASTPRPAAAPLCQAKRQRAEGGWGGGTTRRWSRRRKKGRGGRLRWGVAARVG